MNIRVLLSTVILAVLVASSSFAQHATYSVVALPKDFYVHGIGKSLSDCGKVVGYVGKVREISESRGRNNNDPFFDPYAGAIAAYWDQKKGISTIKLDSYKTMAASINNNGFIALSFYKEKQRYIAQTPRAALWNTKTNEIKLGPAGRAGCINNMNNVLINDGTLWDPSDNTIITPTIDALKLYFPDRFNASNARGTKLFQSNYDHRSNFDLILSYAGKDHLLMLDEGCLSSDTSSMHLNDNDDVVVLTTIKNGELSCNAIAKWEKGKNVVMSDVLQNYPELKGYTFFRIVSFNNKGQILLMADDSKYYPNTFFYSNNLFLMTPLELKITRNTVTPVSVVKTIQAKEVKVAKQKPAKKKTEKKKNNKHNRNKKR